MDTRPYRFGAVWFRVLYEGDRLPAWTSPEVNAKTYVFPGSFPPRSETEIISIGPCQLTWRLAFDSLADYWAMLARLSMTDVLTVPANVQSHQGREYEQHGRQYVDLPGTILLALDEFTPDPDGTIEAVATFQRHIDPATGLLVSS